MKKAIEVCFKLEANKVANIEKILFKEDGIWSECDSLSLDASKFEGSKRGVSFISLEGSKRLADDEIKGFCHKRFKANFVVSGIDVRDLNVGQLLEIGEAIIKVTKVNKDCLTQCPIIKNSNISCHVNKEAFFGEIFKEGLVNKNDKILV